MQNADDRVVKEFGQEWGHFTQSEVPQEEQEWFFRHYFEVFPWDALPSGAQGFDLGCGSGRWAKFVAPKVGLLHCVDASEQALNVARKNLETVRNCRFQHASVDSLPFAPESMDFGYAIGVLHHVPDTQAAIRSCVALLKKGAPFLVYLYYAFDQRPLWYRGVWWLSDLVRRLVCRLPFLVKRWVTSLIAALVYYPLARTARLLEWLRLPLTHWPLKDYRRSTFYSMRTDALDRFGTRLEKRFRKETIQKMMEEAGLQEIVFASKLYWTAVGIKK